MNWFSIIRLHDIMILQSALIGACIGRFIVLGLYIHAIMAILILFINYYTIAWIGHNQRERDNSKNYDFK
jgi:prepilin signal peptidase PulO-like enzyme (type II secretory pathway)